MSTSRLSSLLIETPQRPLDVHPRDWLVRDIDLDLNSSAEVLFIQSYMAYLLTEVLCGLRLALTGKPDAATGPISTDPMRFKWLHITHSLATFTSGNGSREQLYPGPQETQLFLDDFTHIPVQAGCPSLFEIITQEASHEALVEILSAVSCGSLTGIKMDSQSSLQVTNVAGAQVPYHCLSQGQTEQIKAAVSLLLWKTGKAPVLPLPIWHFNTMTEESLVAMVRLACETDTDGQTIILGSPSCISLFGGLNVPISVSTLK